MKKFAALIMALVATVALAAPAQAAVPSNNSDVRYMVNLAKAAWWDIDDDARNAICLWWDIAPYEARDEMAQGFYYDVFEGEFSMYDSKRAAWRVLNWGC